jgi:predicted DNA-binding transcriptional regulator AlpA
MAQWVTLEDAMQRLQRSRSQVYRALQGGNLEKRKKRYHHIRISVASIRKLINSRKIKLPETCLTINEAIEQTKDQFSRNTIYRAAERGEFKAYRICGFPFSGRRWFVSKANFKQWARRKTGSNLPEPCLGLRETGKRLNVTRQRVHQRLQRGDFRSYLQDGRLWIALKSIS